MRVVRIRSRMLLAALATWLAMAAPGVAQTVSPASSAGVATLSQAPPNPKFIEYLNAVKLGMAPAIATPSGHPLGLIPLPIDLSHLSSQTQLRPLTSASIPASYDLRAMNRVTPVKNQLSCGDCWAFGTYGSMESILTASEIDDFSENNLKNLSGFDMGPCAGGNSQMSMAYLARWSGPVKESDDPYQDTDVNTSPSGLPAQKHEQSVIMIPARSSALDNNALKTAVITYGGVQVVMEWVDSAYDSATSSYYYSKDNSANHSVTLVGWDDNYSSVKFATAPPGNGAFLIKNSWGTGFGLAGYFWVSYYDTSLAIADASFAFVDSEPTTNYTWQYEYDPLGWVTSLGYGSATPTTGWFANVFSAAATEELQAVSFYTASNSSEYVVSVYTGATAGPTSGSLAATTSGTLASAGYNTVTLPTPVSLTNGMAFSVVVELTTPGYIYPIPIEFAASGYSSKATASPGQSYISADGSSWEDATDWQSTANVCVKAFTSNTALPAITTLSPTSATAGGAKFTLTINGNNFVSGATATWGTTALATTNVTEKLLTATVPADLITAAGTASVTVTTANGTSNAATFTIKPVAPAAPTLVSPANAATGVSRTPTVSWSAASGATSYDVHLGTTSPPPLVTNTTGTSYAPASLNGSTLYYWQIVAKNSGGSTASAVWSFTTLNPPPAVPTLVSPKNAATGVVLAPKLTWNAAQGATSYNVRFGTTSPPPFVTSTTATSYSPGKLAPGKVYYWRIVATNSVGNTGSATWSFTTQVPPSAPALVAPATGATGVSLTPTLSWNAASAAVSYNVYLGTTSPPSFVVNTTSTSYKPSALAAGKTYYWKVVSQNSAGTASSTIWSFTTTP